ncbi:MAG: GNAT family N-acetyltransferase [Kangiellaceae bacterium]|nr:GNAT family N-acetyltransferase [Kangiellaceae bacterium]
MNIRTTTIKDIVAIQSLYQKVAALTGGLAREEKEIDEHYISDFVKRSLACGLSFVAVRDSQVLGEIHCYSPPESCFSHLLSSLTIAVDPSSQGLGVGRQLFENLMSTVISKMPKILRIELFAKESNRKAIEFYQSLGFRVEGKFESRVKNRQGEFEIDIPMAWLR